MENTVKKPARITKAMRYEDIIAIINGNAPPNESTPEDLIKFCESEREALARKNQSKNADGTVKKSKASIEADENRMKILRLLDEKPGLSCTEIAKELGFESNQKANSLLVKLCPTKGIGVVIPQSVKGTMRFSIKEGVNIEDVVLD